MDFVADGGLRVLHPDGAALGRAFELMVRCADAPMDFADAPLFALAVRLDLRKVFTIDRTDFNFYRIKRGYQYVTFQVIGWLSCVASAGGSSLGTKPTCFSIPPGCPEPLTPLQCGAMLGSDGRPG